MTADGLRLLRDLRRSRLDPPRQLRASKVTKNQHAGIPQNVRQLVE
jgi:hypothetical protein